MGRLTVLGSCGAWPEPGRACSGFLLEHDGFRLVLDLGYGTASRLFTHCAGDQVDAAVITHSHPDHCADLTALTRARFYADAPPLPLYSPPDVLGVLHAVEPRPAPETVVDAHDLETADTIGPFEVRTWRLPHYVPNWGVRLSTSEFTVAYTGDSGPAPEIAELGAEADLLIADATLQGPSPDTEPRYLMTAAEAGSLAARAGAKRLMLTHFWPGSDRARSAGEAAAVFDGEVLLAEEDLVITL